MPDHRKSDPSAATTKALGPEKTPPSPSRPPAPPDSAPRISSPPDSSPPDSSPPISSPRISSPPDSSPPERVAAQQASSPGAAQVPAKRAPGPKRSRLATWAKRLGVGLLALLVVAGVGVALVIRHYEADLPSLRALKSYNPPQVTRVLARDGQLLGELFVERRTLVSIDAIPAQMKLAALAAEDANFYQHTGLNYLGLLRAVLVNLRGGRLRQGGSTITQQVIKNVLLTQERTMDRKMREMILARQIEAELGKDEILELYLNHIYFGHGRYGVEEAARVYFGKSIRDVTLGEAALLAGIIKGPEVFSPRVNLPRALERQHFVLAQMVQKGFATPEQAEKAKSDPVVLAPEIEVLSELGPEVVDEVKRVLRAAVGPEADRGGFTVTTTIDPAMETAARAAVRRNADDYAKRHKLLAPLTKAKKEPAPFEGTPTGHRAYLGVVTGADDAKNTLEVRVGTINGTVDLSTASRYNPSNLPPSKFAEVGKVVRVSLLSPPPAEPARGDAAAKGDPSAATPEEIASAWAAGKKLVKLDVGPSVAEIDPKAKAKPIAKLRLELGPEGALVAIDVRSREVLALVGSYEGTRGGLDRATNSHRQPGSTFKAFVYSYAIHARQMTAASIVETNPAALHGYKPDNYDEGEGKTPKRMRDALAESVNVAAVWSLEKVGASNVVAWTHALGVESKLGADLSLALGSYEVTPREMAGAYATLAAGGVYEQPILVKKITGPNGVEVNLPDRPASRRVMDEAEAYVITSLLTSVVQDGTGKRARALGRPIAGKTGTSNQAKDAWFVGYSTDVACAVWTGFDDPAPLGAGEAGASAALPAFVDFMREAHKKRPAADFPVPPGVTRVAIDPESGLRAYAGQENAIDEVFLTGTEPSETAKPDAGTEGEDAGDASTAIDAGAADASPPTKAEEEAPPPF
jgi:penicillin-binding protein 1A